MTATITRRGVLGTASALAAAAPFRRARARGKPIKIGVLNDMSGPYRDTGGPTSVACVRQAVAEFASHGLPVEIVSGDHQNKPDVGAGIARQWIDTEGVDLIVDVPTSSVALAVNTVCHQRNKAYLNTGAATTDLTGKACTPVTIHWSYDTYMLAHSTAGSLVRAGLKSWFFITADYVFGHQLQRDATAVVKEAGGNVLGAALYPFPSTSDFSAFLVQAQASGAKVVGLANAGEDTVNSVKQAHEFGLTTSGVKLAALLATISVVHSLGLKTAQGLVLTESFYWDLNAGTRAFTKRLIAAQHPPVYPNQEPAACYAGTLHYLKSVMALGAAKAGDGAAIVAHMKSVPAEDDAFGKTVIRADGRAMVPAYLFEAKTPAESKGEWDLYKLVNTTSPANSAPPVSACKLVRS